MNFGIASVAAITVLAYLVGITVKVLPNVNNKMIPIVCGLSGLILGMIAFTIKMPEFPATDIITAAAVGVVSGLAATGIDQIDKQFRNN